VSQRGEEFDAATHRDGSEFSRPQLETRFRMVCQTESARCASVSLQSAGMGADPTRGYVGLECPLTKENLDEELSSLVAASMDEKRFDLRVACSSRSKGPIVTRVGSATTL